jgi:hypothetical protein
VVLGVLPRRGHPRPGGLTLGETCARSFRRGHGSLVLGVYKGLRSIPRNVGKVAEFFVKHPYGKIYKALFFTIGSAGSAHGLSPVSACVADVTRALLEECMRHTPPAAMDTHMAAPGAGYASGARWAFNTAARASGCPVPWTNQVGVVDQSMPPSASNRSPSGSKRLHGLLLEPA